MTSSHSTHSHEKHMRITWTLNSIVQTWNLLEVLLSKLLDFELSIVWTKNLLEVLLLKIVCWTTKQYNLLYYKFCILIISIVWWYNLLYYNFAYSSFPLYDDTTYCIINLAYSSVLLFQLCDGAIKQYWWCNLLLKGNSPNLV